MEVIAQLTANDTCYPAFTTTVVSDDFCWVAMLWEPLCGTSRDNLQPSAKHPRSVASRVEKWPWDFHPDQWPSCGSIPWSSSPQRLAPDANGLHHWFGPFPSGIIPPYDLPLTSSYIHLTSILHPSYIHLASILHPSYIPLYPSKSCLAKVEVVTCIPWGLQTLKIVQLSCDLLHVVANILITRNFSWMIQMDPNGSKWVSLGCHLGVTWLCSFKMFPNCHPGHRV